jgi:hypothetical protein
MREKKKSVCVRVDGLVVVVTRPGPGKKILVGFFGLTENPSDHVRSGRNSHSRLEVPWWVGVGGGTTTLRAHLDEYVDEMLQAARAGLV